MPRTPMTGRLVWVIRLKSLDSSCICASVHRYIGGKLRASWIFRAAGAQKKQANTRMNDVQYFHGTGFSGTEAVHFLPLFVNSWASSLGCSKEMKCPEGSRWVTGCLK